MKRNKIKKTPKTILSFVLIMAMVINCILPITNVFAAASTTKLIVSFRANEQVDNADLGIVQYSLNDGASWNDITSNTGENGLAITVTGDNLKLRLVPNANYDVDYAGIGLSLDNTPVDNVSSLGLDTNEGYSVPSNAQTVSLGNVEFRESENKPNGNIVQAHATVNISGAELEYDHDWDNNATGFVFGINDSEMRYISKEEVNYTVEGESIVGLVTKNSLGLTYDYDNSGKVTFHIRTQWDDVITSLKINNVTYNTPQTRDALIEAYDNGGIAFDIENVPYAENYIIEVTGRKQTEQEKIMGNFGWTYDEHTNQYSEDDKILHGILEFVSAEYNNQKYTTIEAVNNAGGLFAWNDGVRDTDDPTGEATLPVGTILTLRLIPDEGYQLTSFDLNGTPFEPGEEPGIYTFEIGGGNWHLGAHFTEEGNIVQATSKNVTNGNINTTEKVQNGTLKLEVSNIGSMSPTREESFVNKADEETFEIDSYMDISLYNAIYKGGKKDANNNYESWDTEVNNLKDKATITLELKDDMSGKDVVLVHEKHDGDKLEYEIIETVYDEKNNSITFETDSFSTYALAVKGEEENTEQEENDNQDDKTQSYTVEDSEGNTITFNEIPDREYELTIVDYLSYTKEEVIEMAGITSEVYDEAIGIIKELASQEGTLISLFEISVVDKVDGHNIAQGPLTIRIKITDDMKNYNSFKLLYISDNQVIEDIVELTIDGDYLVGTIPHLSQYVLVGDTIQNSVDNPETGDKIMTYINLLTICTLGFTSCGIYLRKLYN